RGEGTKQLVALRPEDRRPAPGRGEPLCDSRRSSRHRGRRLRFIALDGSQKRGKIGRAKRARGRLAHLSWVGLKVSNQSRVGMSWIFFKSAAAATLGITTMAVMRSASDSSWSVLNV